MGELIFSRYQMRACWAKNARFSFHMPIQERSLSLQKGRGAPWALLILLIPLNPVALDMGSV
jgi:hypothetical protein